MKLTETRKYGKLLAVANLEGSSWETVFPKSVESLVPYVREQLGGVVTIYSNCTQNLSEAKREPRSEWRDNSQDLSFLLNYGPLMCSHCQDHLAVRGTGDWVLRYQSQEQNRAEKNGSASIFSFTHKKPTFSIQVNLSILRASMLLPMCQ